METDSSDSLTVTYAGSCHCGDLRIEYQTTLLPAQWPLRECQCSFCRKHAMLSTSDPDGEIVLTLRHPAALNRYRFATGVTDFLICARCGVYVGATVVNDGWMVLNGRLMDCAASLVARTAEPRVLDNESADERIARRQQMWSRCRVDVRARPSS
jgi:hypothetical protein